jgi:hypothetical protein
VIEGALSGHPLLRTASLQRLDRQAAADLICLAEALAEEPEAFAPGEVAALVARDLWQCREELEVFEEVLPVERSVPVQGARSGLLDLVRAMGSAGRKGAGPGDPRDPLRSLAALRIREPVRGALGRVGGGLAELYAEGILAPAMRTAPLVAVATGVLADLEYLAAVLRREQEQCGATQRNVWVSWVTSIEEGLSGLREVLPTTMDPACTTVEMPVLRDPEG